MRRACLPLPRPVQYGVQLIGHGPIGRRMGDRQLVWIDQCRYVSGAPMLNDVGGVETGPARPFLPTDCVEVIEASNREKPRQVNLVLDRGALWTVETIDAVDRKVVVAGENAAGNEHFSSDDPPVFDIYDITDSAGPKLMSEYVWPENIRTLRLLPDGRRLYATALPKGKPLGAGGIHALDSSDPSRLRYAGHFDTRPPYGRSGPFETHEMPIGPDERRIYASMIPPASTRDMHAAETAARSGNAKRAARVMLTARVMSHNLISRSYCPSLTAKRGVNALITHRKPTWPRRP